MYFDFFQEDEEVLNLADDTKVTVSILNPILLAIKYRSFSCLKYLVQEFGIRQSMKPIEIIVRHENAGEYAFKNLMIAILAKLKDVEALSFVTRQDGFVLTTQDLNSFLSITLHERWLGGVKAFLASPVAQFYFTVLSFEEQKLLVERIVKAINDIEDAKT